jgi:two-component system OmpR family response regulator
MKPVLLHKILHIDDDPIMRIMVKKALERSQKKFSIVSCATANEFMTHLSSFSPDLLMIDVMMPIIDGPTLLSRVREKSIMIPVIFVTGKEFIDLEDRGKLEPIIGVLQKPFSPALIGEHLELLWKNQFI